MSQLQRVSEGQRASESAAAAVLVMKPKPGTCRFCGCTDERGCALLCWWIDAEDTVCSAPKCVEFYFAEMRAEMKASMERLGTSLFGPDRGNDTGGAA